MSIKVQGFGATRIFTYDDIDAPALHAATLFILFLSLARVLTLFVVVFSGPFHLQQEASFSLWELRRSLLIGTGHRARRSERWQGQERSVV